MRERNDTGCWAWLGLCLALVGCGGGDSGQGGSGGFQSDQTCGLRLKLEGGLAASYTGDDSEFACVFPVGPGGIHTSFVPIQGDLGSFTLEVSELEKGATGEGFAAELSLRADDDRTWETKDCSVAVERHAFFEKAEIGEHYRAVGSGSCATPAPPVSGDDAPVTIQPFDFVVLINWAG